MGEVGRTVAQGTGYLHTTDALHFPALRSSHHVPHHVDLAVPPVLLAGPAVLSEPANDQLRVLHKLPQYSGEYSGDEALPGVLA